MPGSHTDEVIRKSHPDWKSFKGKAAQGVVFTNFAYKQTDEEMQAMAESMPEGYELFLMTDHVEDNKEASFRCVAFVNQKTKEIVFATAGTRPGLDQKGVDDLYDDVLLIAQEKPRKMNPAQILNDMILDSLGDAAKDYKFHYTGHSLGAAMAEMQAADMDIKLTQKGLKQEENREQITAVTFENPGTKAILEKMYEDAGLPKENVEKLNLCEFNNRNNIINSLNEQAGRTYTIVPHSQKRNPSMAQMVFEVVAKYVAELSPMLGKALSLLAPGGVDISLVGDHSLSNFDEVFVKQEGSVKNSEGKTISLEEAYSGVKPVEYDSRVADKISSMKIENGNIGKQEFSMNKLNPETGQLDRLVFSHQEVKVAVNSLRQVMPKKGSMTERVRQEMSIGKEVPTLKLPTVGEIVNSGMIRGV